MKIAAMLIAFGVGCSAVTPALAEYKARAVVQAVNRAELSSELAGRITRLPHRMGDAFSKGDVLVGLDCRLYEAQASKVAAELDAAKVKLESTEELKELNAIGDMDVALAESEYAQSRAELSIARINTRRCNVQAPWDGRVSELRVSRHENVQQQQPLIIIVDDSSLEAEVVVPAAWLAWLEPGQEVELRAESLGVTAEARVSAISPAIDAVSQTVLLRATLSPDAALVPGITATAVFLPTLSKDQ
ncbi:efflux RND transporter periplasmic adaptor subunit [Marinobacter lacisalsi]|uniref:Efflux RND transporter periplasmic adaptor subunit n=1 Tax=Marinobacter lacisalsi TaxID=475979 RepID=A0ABV8QL44_9GAMM